MKKIEDLVRRLEAIAKKNNDKFRYCIKITANLRRPGLLYEFIAEETADGHTMFYGQGATIEAACDDANTRVYDDCRGWDYKE